MLGDRTAVCKMVAKGKHWQNSTDNHYLLINYVIPLNKAWILTKTHFTIHSYIMLTIDLTCSYITVSSCHSPNNIRLLLCYTECVDEGTRPLSWETKPCCHKAEKGLECIICISLVLKCWIFVTRWNVFGWLPALATVKNVWDTWELWCCWTRSRMLACSSPTPLKSMDTHQWLLKWES